MRKRINKGYTRAPKKKSQMFLSAVSRVREGQPDLNVAMCVGALSVQELRYLAHIITNYKDRRRYEFPITQRLIHLLIAKAKLKEEAELIKKETKGEIVI